MFTNSAVDKQVNTVMAHYGTRSFAANAENMETLPVFQIHRLLNMLFLYFPNMTKAGGKTS